MAKREYDIAVIGSGPGGYVAAIRAAQLGFKTICIEKSKSLGGTCLNVGCIPSKALLQSTEHYDFIQKHSGEHGIDVTGVSFRFDDMMKRKGEVVKANTDGVAGLFKRNGIDRLEGTGRFVSSHLLEVTAGGEKILIEAKNIIIATGSESVPLPFLPFDEKMILSSTGALALDHVPKRMVVIGGGVIGVELASVYNRLGTQITVVEMMDRICPMMDNAISKSLLQILQKQGMTFHLNSKVTSATKEKSTISLVVVKDKETLRLDADAVLVSVGRRPFTGGLGLAEVGVEVDAKGFIKVDDLFKTSQSHIYAIGDVIDGAMLAHRASEEGVAAVEIIAGHLPHINYMAIPNVVYTHPEVAALGLTEKEAKELGLELKVGTCFFKGNPRARCAGDTDGFVKVIGEATSGRLIGMHMIGANASEMIGEGVLAMTKRATLEDIANASHAHPTRTEAIKEAALSALGRAIHI